MDRDVPANERFTDISDLVEHPITVQPPGEPNKPIGIPVMLTSKERKKLRRQRRREAEKEKQEKIQFGMIDKPEPKVAKPGCIVATVWGPDHRVVTCTPT